MRKLLCIFFPNTQSNKNSLGFHKIHERHSYENDNKLTLNLILRWENPHSATLKMSRGFLTEVIQRRGVTNTTEDGVNGVRDVSPWSQTSDTTQDFISSVFIEPCFSRPDCRTNPSVAQKTQTFYNNACKFEFIDIQLNNRN